MKKNRSKSKGQKTSLTTAAAAAASPESLEQTISARLEGAMKNLADTAKQTSDPMELVPLVIALLKIVPLAQGK
jgi:hypothetical protein